MKQYKAILFDVDQTLLDFIASERCAFYQTTAHWGIECDDELLQLYSSSNKEAWLLYEQGKLSKDRLTVYRFERFFERAGYQFDPVEWNNYYKGQLGNTAFLLDGAREILDFSCQNFDIYIITNGIASVQHSRLEKADIKHYFQKIFISEEIGAQKPSAEYFEAVFNNIPYSKEEALIIGDSLTSDIAGGIAFGVDTCFINWNDIMPEQKPTYTVSNLKGVLELLMKIKAQ